MAKVDRPKGPQFYKWRDHDAIMRTWDHFTVDHWSDEKGWWRDDDPEAAFSDLNSPQWSRITPDEAQTLISGWGGADDAAMAPVKK